MGCCISIRRNNKTKINQIIETTDHEEHFQPPLVSSRSYKIINNDTLNYYRISKISSGAMRSSGSDISHHSVHRPRSQTRNNIIHTGRILI